MYSTLLNRRRFFLIICMIIIFSILKSYIYFEYDLTNERIRKLLLLAENKSFCSERAALRGYNQYVLSVSAYESNDNKGLTTSLTWTYINIFVNEAKKFYPTWIVRVYYYNLFNKTKDDIMKLEKLYDNLDFCDVEHLPVLGNMKNKLPGKMQRFLSASKYFKKKIFYFHMLFS